MWKVRARKSHPASVFYGVILRLNNRDGRELCIIKVNAREYIPERTAAVAAKLQIRDAAEYERELPTVE